MPSRMRRTIEGGDGGWRSRGRRILCFFRHVWWSWSAVGGVAGGPLPLRIFRQCFLRCVLIVAESGDPDHDNTGSQQSAPSGAIFLEHFVKLLSSAPSGGFFFRV